MSAAAAADAMAARLSGAPPLAKETEKFTLLDLERYAGEVRCYHHLIDISGEDKVTMEESLVEHVKNTIDKLKKLSRKDIELVYLGKTYVGKKKKKCFNRLDPETWKKKGIKARWEDHYSKIKTTTNSRKEYVDANYAKDGMVVLCVFTEEGIYFSLFDCGKQK